MWTPTTGQAMHPIFSRNSVYSKSCSKIKKRNSYTAAVVTTEMVDGYFFEIDYFIFNKSSRHVFAVGQLLHASVGMLLINAPHIQ